MMFTCEWTLIDQPTTFSCHDCDSSEIEFRTWEDDEGHEDIKYHCINCGKKWWVEGADY